MTKYALVNNNVVSEIREGLTEDEIVAIGRSYQSIVDVTDLVEAPEAGWTLDGATFLPPPGTSGSVKITRLAFRNRFTSEEKAALYNMLSQPQGVALRIYLDDLAASAYVDLKRPDTISAVNTLAAIGLIAPERVSQVLSLTVSPVERYRG